MFEKVVQNVPLQELDGSTYRSFEECLGWRFGAREARLRPDDKRIIKEAWKKEVRMHYRNRTEGRKLIKIGTGHLVLAAPIGPDVEIMRKAVAAWRQEMQAALDAAVEEEAIDEPAPGETSSEEEDA